MLHLRDDSDARQNQYDYHPSLAAGVIFVLLFSVLSAIHLGILIKSRIWWTIVILIGGLGELVGWAGRVWSSENDANHSAFILQIVLLVIVPSFFSAACYGITGMLIRIVGPHFSILRPAWFLRVFCTADFVCIFVQCVGGAMASSDSIDVSNTGTHIMLAGIVLQLISMLAFVLVAGHFYLAARAAVVGRAAYAHSFDTVSGVDSLTTKPVRTLIHTLTLASMAIIVRGVYRTVELAQGWHGYTMRHEAFFDLLDAVPMVLCIAFLAPAHPYFGLPNRGKPINPGALAFQDNDTATTEATSSAPFASKYKL